MYVESVTANRWYLCKTTPMREYINTLIICVELGCVAVFLLCAYVCVCGVCVCVCEYVIAYVGVWTALRHAEYIFL